MCVCVCVCVCVCLCVYVFIYGCVVCVCVCIYLSIYLPISLHTYMHTCTNNMYVCMCIYIACAHTPRVTLQVGNRFGGAEARAELQATEGDGFVAAWDEWARFGPEEEDRLPELEEAMVGMWGLLGKSRRSPAGGPGLHSGGPGLHSGGSALGSGRAVLHSETWTVDASLAPGQPHLAADIFAPNGTLLRRLLLPPTAAQRSGLSTADEAIAFPPHAAHYGHEDLMALQFAAQPGTDPFSAVEGATEAARATAGRAAAAARVMAAQAPHQGGAPGSKTPLAGRRRVASLSFEDGSGCRCDAECVGAKKPYARGCCVDWGHVCEPHRVA